MRRVHIHEAASREAIEAAAWYELKRPGLGVEFQRAIETALDLLGEDVVSLTPVHSAAKVRGEAPNPQTLSFRRRRGRPSNRSLCHRLCASR
jgi:hypothetical protein